ncbi:sporulation histidine kinase inhibitor Sda [Paenibacillus thermotolerans]|nr:MULTISPECIES: sporulation histidine kinase inhibitor Sda [unclassified Paenibacillus]
MQNLTDEALITAYQIALKLQLEEEFIKLLQDEMKRRDLMDKVSKQQA